MAAIVFLPFCADRRTLLTQHIIFVKKGLKLFWFILTFISLIFRKRGKWRCKVSEDKKNIVLLIGAVTTYYPSVLSPDKDNPSLYRFADVPQPPDPFLTDDYVAKHRGKGTTIVIDNGAF